MSDVTGATSFSLQPTGGGDLVAQLNTAAARWGSGWWVTAATVVLGLVAMPYSLLLWIIAAPLCAWLFFRDSARRTVVLFDDVNDAPAAWFGAVINHWRWLTESQRMWRVIQSGQVTTTYQHKTNAGASSVVNRIAAYAGFQAPKHLATNVAVASIDAGKSSLHFLPDRILVRDGTRYSDVSYAQLHSRGSKQRFIEGPGPVPTDAQQVDQTWQYVNVRGGPDRRYRNNPVLPIMLYGHLDLTTPSGLNCRLTVSRADAGPSVAQTLTAAPIVPIAS